MIRITDILDKIAKNNPDTDVDLVERAYIYSAKVHSGQTRLSGEPYLTHPLEVAGILADMNLDTVSVAAALLHDVIEDTHATEEQIGEMFGQEVLHIVAGVTKMSKLAFTTSQARHAESIRKMLLAMSNDIRVIFIKLADRLHNMRTLNFHKKESKKKQIAGETLDIYAPIASRLGIYWIKKELEDTAFMYLQPEHYSNVKQLVSKDKIDREGYIESVVSILKDKMEKSGLKCEVLGRYKHFYSIYQKMVKQNLPFENIYDIIAFRIIVDTTSQCYEILGHIHALWRPIPARFKDYIGLAKPNGYQSLHTTVIGPRGERIEIQIRTREMDEVARFGIAAHWGYKEGKTGIDENIGKQFSWLQNLIESDEGIRDPEEFMESVRIDLFPDEIYVFTPVGDVKCLTKGATPVDFAYAIHTEVGDQCVGAKVNGAMVPLRHELQTGDVVEISTSKGHQPSRDWLKFVKTVKARSKIRQWIKTQEKERSITLGREMCEKAFQKHRLNYHTLVKSGEMEKVIEYFGFKTLDDLIANVGYGKVTPLHVVRRFLPKAQEEENNDSFFNKLIRRVTKKKTKTGVLVKGMDDILVKFGKCCQPVPGDPVTGYITRGFGVTVHKKTCINALKMNPERQIDVEWTEHMTETYPAKIRVLSHDRFRLLADLADNISKNGANILDVSSKVRENKMVESLFTIAVANTGQLNNILVSLKKVKLVHEVERVSK